MYKSKNESNKHFKNVRSQTKYMFILKCTIKKCNENLMLTNRTDSNWNSIKHAAWAQTI